jgi:hypothetical protein
MLRVCYETAFDRVAVNVLEHFGESFFAADVAVEVAVLPKLLAGTSKLSGRRLFEGFEELSEQDVLGLVDEQMDVLGHEDVGIDTGFMAEPGPFEDGLDDVLGLRAGEVGETVEATEGNEVERLGLLVSLQTVGHGCIVSWMVLGLKTHSSR